MQTSYLSEHVPGYEGDLADSAPRKVLPLRNNLDVDLPYGRAVAHDAGTGTSDVAAKLPVAIGDKILGVSVNSRAHAEGPTDIYGADGVRPDGMFDALSQGTVYVLPEQDVTVASAVFVRFGAGATGGTAPHDTPGRFRADADIVTAWATETAYTLGQRRTNDSGKVYECITAGTSAASGGPTGTNADITDGTAHWAYKGTCDSSTRASAVALAGARWTAGATATSGLVATLEVNLPQ